MANLPKYISDTPYGNDFFNIHSQIATTLKDIIKTEDVSTFSFTLGLLGSWGSGKSLTVKLLRDHLKNERDIIFIEFDVWKYIDTSLYRSILMDLETSLKEKASLGQVNIKYEDGIKTTEGKNLYEVLYKSSQTSKPEVEIPKDKLSKLIHKWETDGPLWEFLSYISLRIADTLWVLFNYFRRRSRLFYFLVGLGSFFSLIYYYKSNIIDFFPFLSDKYLKPIFQFLIYTTIGLSAVELIKEAFKDLFNTLLPKSEKNIIITEPPTFAQDQFESIFRSVVKDICADPNKKLVLVFDNIDRCEAEIATQVLSGLKTFLDEPKCFYLIPCDDGKIKKYFSNSGAENDFLDKIFQAYIRIPLMPEENRIAFIEDCISKAQFNLANSDRIKISQILTFAYKGETPRQIKRFFNDFVSYYKLAKTIDPQEKFLLKDIAHFTFMITIKQKWPQIEEILILHPNAFNNYHEKQSIPDFKSPEFLKFLESCINWIDLDSNVADFIYLTDAKQSGSNVQRIILEDFDGFVLNRSLVKDFGHFISSLIGESKYIFFEKAMERLMLLTTKYLKETDNTNGIELLKVYIKFVIQYDRISIDNKKQSYILSHNSFFTDHVMFLSKIDKNRIDEFEAHACKIIKELGYTDVTSRLFTTFLNNFKLKNLRKIFEDIGGDTWKKLNPFIINSDLTLTTEIVPSSFLEQIVTSLNFNKKDNEAINTLKLFQDKSKFADVRKNIGIKLDQFFGAIHATQGPHQSESFIIEGMNLVGKDDLNDTVKRNLSNNIQTRIQILIQHGQTVWAVNYLIQSLRLNLDKSATILQNGHFNQKQFFTPFIQGITPEALEIGLRDTTIREIILTHNKSFGTDELFFSKISNAYLVSNSKGLCSNNLKNLISLLNEVSRRQSQLSNDEYEKIENDIIDQYTTLNNDLLIGNFEEVLPRIRTVKNKEILIEKVYSYFKPNPNENTDKLIKALSFIETGMSLVHLKDAIDSLITILGNYFNIGNQISAINILNKYQKNNFTVAQVKLLEQLISEIDVGDSAQQKSVEDLKAKLNLKIRKLENIEFQFTKQPTDDHYYPVPLNLDKFNYEITVKPTSEYWRLGLKFRKDSAFTTSRQQNATPLFHLTKDDNSESLRVTYYPNEQPSQRPHGDHVIIEKYSKETLTFSVSVKNKDIQVTIKEGDKELLDAPLLSTDYKFFTISAWGDQKDCQINTSIKRIPHN